MSSQDARTGAPSGAPRSNLNRTTATTGKKTETMNPVRIAVAGAGLIGHAHIKRAVANDSIELSAIVDPGPVGPGLAATYGVALYRSLEELFAADKPDGDILATPNQLHVEGALKCIAAGVPVLVEKPITDSVEGAEQIVAAGQLAGVPVLTGHHRQHSPIMAKAKDIINSGRLGTIVGVVGAALFYKPDLYFDDNGGWRRKPGGGPMMLNLIHEVNQLESLIGDITSVQAVSSNATRGFPVEDTAAMVFQFANGALGTFLLSDTAASARSWELTSQENKEYPTYGDEDSFHIAGTKGSLSVPTMRVKLYDGTPSWWEPLTESTESVNRTDPLSNQIAHFAAVIKGQEDPIVSGMAGLKSLRVVNAVREAARTGAPVEIRAVGAVLPA
jgi:predicted dehydrogenase